jgi:hypothetical protein
MKKGKRDTRDKERKDVSGQYIVRVNVLFLLSFYAHLYTQTHCFSSISKCWQCSQYQLALHARDKIKFKDFFPLKDRQRLFSSSICFFLCRISGGNEKLKLKLAAGEKFFISFLYEDENFRDEIPR